MSVSSKTQVQKWFIRLFRHSRRLKPNPCLVLVTGILSSAHVPTVTNMPSVLQKQNWCSFFKGRLCGKIMHLSNSSFLLTFFFLFSKMQQKTRALIPAAVRSPTSFPICETHLCAICSCSRLLMKYEQTFRVSYASSFVEQLCDHQNHWHSSFNLQPQREKQVF